MALAWLLTSDDKLRVWKDGFFKVVAVFKSFSALLSLPSYQPLLLS
ncbi:hypothetical protein NEOC95_001487 [Neochlamydia sp. AcF95]|nr:hypothetical protein [Neochlamydia sp. AcF95]